MYLWETVKPSPSVIGYFALSMLVGVRAPPRAALALLLATPHACPQGPRVALSWPTAPAVNSVCSLAEGAPSAPTPLHHTTVLSLNRDFITTQTPYSSPLLLGSRAHCNKRQYSPQHPQGEMPFGFQKLPVRPSVLRYNINNFFNFFLFLYYIFKRQYLLYCEFAVEDA